MPKPTCLQLKIQLAEIQDLFREFALELGKVREIRKTEHLLELQKEIGEKIESLQKEFAPKEMKAIWINPETNEQKEISVNIQEKIEEWQAFSQKHNLPPNSHNRYFKFIRKFNKKHNLPSISQQEIMSIWKNNHQEIKAEIEKYGYDNLLIIPEDMPDSENFHQQMTEGYANTYQLDNFKEGGGFARAKHTENRKTKIILCHNDQNIYENADANVFGKETLGKNIMQLSGLTQAEIEKRIQNQENIPINFEAIINGKTIQIEAEGLSLNVYLIFQRQYFEKNQKHLDEEGWTWLLKTFSASRVVDSGWYNDSQLGVSAADSDASDGHLACRLSRSFSS